MIRWRNGVGRCSGGFIGERTRSGINERNESDRIR
jgi:hypothetical protein